jgi:hypothetical protein
MISFALSDALLHIDINVYGKVDSGTFNHADEAQGYLAAHKLALSPYGQAARLSDKTDDTLYMRHFKAIRSAVTSGLRVTGNAPTNSGVAANNAGLCYPFFPRFPF